MERDRISAALLAAPAWARVGLTMIDRHMRERAADAIAASIIERHRDGSADPNQLMLPLR